MLKNNNLAIELDWAIRDEFKDASESLMDYFYISDDMVEYLFFEHLEDLLNNRIFLELVNRLKKDIK